MSAISTILTRLRAAIWAIDVRDDIANAIEQCYSDVSNPTLRTEALEAALQNKIDQGKMAALTIGDGTITAAKLASGVIDNTLATSGAAADAKKTGDKIAAVKADLGAQTGLFHWHELGLIDLSGSSANLTPETNLGINCAVVECSAGDKFIITASGGNKSRIWGFIDENNAILTVSDKNLTVENLEITAPTNAVKLILNAYINSDIYAYKVGNNLATKASNGLSDEAKEAILDCFRNVALTAENESFNALLEAFGVSDFYNTWEWTCPSRLAMVKKAAVDPNINSVPTRITITDSVRRRTITCKRGKAPYYYADGVRSEDYPIPIPRAAKKVIISSSLSNTFAYFHTVRFDGESYSDSIVENKVTWTQLPIEKTLENTGNLFMVLNLKYTSSGTDFPSEPDAVITFLEE